jgi:hypothetical protein
MKIKKILVPAFVVSSAIAVYAASDGALLNEDDGNSGSSCSGAGGSCVMTDWKDWYCDGTSSTTCSPVPKYPASTWPGTCVKGGTPRQPSYSCQ